MKSLFTIFTILFVLFLLVGIGWLLTGNDLAMYSFYAPKYANTQREVFENTNSYERGMIQTLEKDQIEYIKSTPEQQTALAPVILQQLGEFDESKLPVSLRKFVEQLRTEQNTNR